MTNRIPNELTIGDLIRSKLGVSHYRVTYFYVYDDGETNVVMNANRTARLLLARSARS